MRVTVQITAGPAQGQSFVFDQPDTFLFGRAKDARVPLPDDPYLSRHHFMIEIAPPHCRLSDLGSKNGTFVNHAPVRGRQPLSDRDEIDVGPERLIVRIVREPVSTRTQPR